jgi:hypothetical protein
MAALPHSIWLFRGGEFGVGRWHWHGISENFRHEIS